jgi:hypothetical protein
MMGNPFILRYDVSCVPVTPHKSHDISYFTLGDLDDGTLFFSSEAVFYSCDYLISVEGVLNKPGRNKDVLFVKIVGDDKAVATSGAPQCPRNQVHFPGQTISLVFKLHDGAIPNEVL